ncbi:PHD finger family protein [Actinidia rufa]|uniref:PHD finger family protein n=1 Tax=Actinidia rufa TaxID=165716 RepID=A0A7J0EIF2_9ERIC|nr:PHD finger family protein [Actinidia rufa]
MLCLAVTFTIRNKMVKLQNAVLFKGPRNFSFGAVFQFWAMLCNPRVEVLTPSDMISKFDGPKLEQLVEARNDLIHKVVKSLPQEIDDIGKRKWDAVLVNQYHSELRKAKKKQGWKERRHKDALAVLAAAAAASLRNSSFRKDALDKSAHQEARLYFQQMPRVKETLSKLAAPRVSSEMKVGVHLDCYRSVIDSTGPWYCELCEEFLSSNSSGAAAVNSWEKPYFAAECGLCGRSAGAFR